MAKKSKRSKKRPTSTNEDANSKQCERIKRWFVVFLFICICGHLIQTNPAVGQFVYPLVKPIQSFFHEKTLQFTEMEQIEINEEIKSRQDDLEVLKGRPLDRDERALLDFKTKLDKKGWNVKEGTGRKTQRKNRHKPGG